MCVSMRVHLYEILILIYRYLSMRMYIYVYYNNYKYYVLKKKTLYINNFFIII